ncbi:helix-turn-helix domain-containing protein [Hydrogenophaga sp. BPS33]|uniref:helix-turn-helix domain-containing protein n=1 Tax=Hydrogenophaga sp. BPS33 TaxID=2651974 RepID=UPI0013204CDC|nr:helix-turn-helix transcriptional regulator [Hydrogenophaga sp. BPS33]QHE84735.1 helix-turn-helix domain-containing protein [Hydrogenophaga sp. BPS33]
MPRLSDPSSLFGRRLRAARGRAGIPQDRLGVAIGLDESSSSARMSRYETGVHEPPFATAQNLAKVLKIPVAYFYCDDERLAEFLIQYGGLDAGRRRKVLSVAAELSAEME